MNNPIRIIIVDGRALVRHGLQHILEPEENMKIIGDYASAEEVLFKTLRVSNDIILMGTQLPGMNWIEAVRSLKRHRQNFGGEVIILAESAGYRTEAMEAGAAGYLLKDVMPAELIQTVRQVYRNKRSLKDYESFIEEEIELVIPPPVNSAELMGFMCRLAEMLPEGKDSIICTVGSWERGTISTIRLQSAASSGLVIELANMPEVERVEEESLAKVPLIGLSKKLGLSGGSGSNTSKRIRLTLRDTSVVSQRATVLN